jgi:hypothetical protein
MHGKRLKSFWEGTETETRHEIDFLFCFCCRRAGARPEEDFRQLDQLLSIQGT